MEPAPNTVPWVFRATRSEINWAIAIALITLAGVAVFALLTGPGLTKKQNESFELAWQSLEVPLAKPLMREDALLSVSGDIYSWRALIYKQSDAPGKASIWICDVKYEGSSFHVLSSRVTEYDETLARELGLDENPIKKRDSRNN